MSTYSDHLLSVFKSPRFRNVPKNIVSETEHINTTCGDHIHLYENKEGELSWDGKGCMICLASAEILCQLHSENQDLKEIRSRLQPVKPQEKEDVRIAALQETLHDFPVRSKCVMLAWEGV